MFKKYPNYEYINKSWLQISAAESPIDVVNISLQALKDCFELGFVSFLPVNDIESLSSIALEKYYDNEKKYLDFLRQKLSDLAFINKLLDESFVIEPYELFIPIILDNKSLHYLWHLRFKDNAVVEDNLLLMLIDYIRFVMNNVSKLALIEDYILHAEDLVSEHESRLQVLSTVSHELRTPLSVILGFSELLNNFDYPAEQRKQFIQDIYIGAKRLNTLVDDFLDFSKIQANGKIQLKDFILVELDFVVEVAWEQFLKRNTNFHLRWINKEKDIPSVRVDQSAIERVFVNLFQNAIKYSELILDTEDRVIECKFDFLSFAELSSVLARTVFKNHFQQKALDSETSYVVVTVRDYGVGIEADKAIMVFEKFYRVNNSDTQTIGGTGLGLWICRQILDAHQGYIFCQPAVDNLGGTEFSVAFPVLVGDR